MDKPIIIGWEVTVNENGIKMATLPQQDLIALMNYADEVEKNSITYFLKNAYVTALSAKEFKRVCVVCGKESTEGFEERTGWWCIQCSKTNALV
jgi:anaerobic ribonucleoside-triphosphate reductase